MSEQFRLRNQWNYDECLIKLPSLWGPRGAERLPDRSRQALFQRVLHLILLKIWRGYSRERAPKSFSEMGVPKCSWPSHIFLFLRQPIPVVCIFSQAVRSCRFTWMPFLELSETFLSKRAHLKKGWSSVIPALPQIRHVPAGDAQT